VEAVVAWNFAVITQPATSNKIACPKDIRRVVIARPSSSGATSTRQSDQPSSKLSIGDKSTRTAPLGNPPVLCLIRRGRRPAASFRSSHLLILPFSLCASPQHKHNGYPILQPLRCRLRRCFGVLGLLRPRHGRPCLRVWASFLFPGPDVSVNNTAAHIDRDAKVL
jgi:hypothetical protein